MPELLKSALAFLAPPSLDDREGRVRWMWSVTIMILTLGAVILVHIALACGWAPSVYDGFARKEQLAVLESQIKSVASDVDMSLRLNLAKEMRDNQENRCTATSNFQKQNLSSLIDSEQQYYYRRFGVYYQLPDCTQL